MGMSPYSYNVYIAPDSDFDFDAFHARLEALYKGRPFKWERVKREGDRVRVCDKRWSYHIHHSTADHVSEEAEEMIQFVPEGDPRRAALAACTRRVDLWGDADGDMAYFHHCSIVLDELQAHKGIMVFDPMEPGFLS